MNVLFVMMVKPIWIELVDKGVANRFSLPNEELIEINWRLTEYPKLYYNVLQHELKHDENNFTAKDLKHDMFSRTPGLWKFMIKNPSTWVQLLPIYYDRKRKSFVYDWSAIIMWWMLIAWAWVTYWLLGMIL